MMAAGSRAGPLAGGAPAAEATLMFREATQAAGVLRAQFQRNDAALLELGDRLRRLAPRAVVTCARGSSDHAATFAKYLVETRANVLTASAAPSVSSIYLARQDLRGCLFLAISQSGRSPDLLACAQQARAAGALVVALVNSEDSPLSEIAQHTLPLCAGEECSVAATKSFIASLAALLHLVGAWSNDAALLDALRAAPAQLEQAWALDWSPALPVLAPASNLYVIGRGLGLGIALEAALKCKETSGLHAEGFSSAEVLHGPAALLGPRFPALLLAQQDDTHDGVAGLAAELAAREVPLLGAGVGGRGIVELPTLTAHPAIQPLLLVQSFYRLANALSLARGHDPDRPPHLRKVTRTL
jgi:glucosamine--fructose-6-phosphate aminotransferase (isomerizing)